MKALPPEPCMDCDLAEELLHDSLRRTGWRDRTLAWRATLLARATVWHNHLRAAGMPFDSARRVVDEARRMVADRKTEITQEQDPAWPAYRDLLPDPERRIPHGGGFPPWMLRPPAGWTLGDDT